MMGQSEINKHEKKSYYDHDPEKKQNRFGPLWSETYLHYSTVAWRYVIMTCSEAQPLKKQ